MVEKISVRTFALLLILVMFVSIIGTTYVLTTLGMINIPSKQSRGYGVVTVNVIIPENMTAQESIVSIVPSETTGG